MLKVDLNFANTVKCLHKHDEKNSRTHTKAPTLHIRENSNTKYITIMLNISYSLNSSLG